MLQTAPHNYVRVKSRSAANVNREVYLTVTHGRFEPLLLVLDLNSGTATSNASVQLCTWTIRWCQTDL